MKYIHIAPWRVWRWMLKFDYPDRRIGLFRNLPYVKPGRWGIFFFGLEIGSRQPQNPVGVWLKQHGLYPW